MRDPVQSSQPGVWGGRRGGEGEERGEPSRGGEPGGGEPGARLAGLLPALQ